MPKININIFCFTIIFFWQTHLSANSLKDVLVEAIDKDRSCFSYVPNIGKVTDIDNLDVKSDQFEITDEKVLILNGNVELDFPDGTMFAGKARIDRTSGSVEFKKNGDIYLNDYFFRASEGIFNKDNKSLNLKNGQVFLKNRNLILDFEGLDGSIDNKIVLKKVSMTTCAIPENGWLLSADSIDLFGKSNRGLARNVRVKVLDRTIARLPVVPFPTTNERMTGFLEPSISYSSDGFDLMVPYFKVLSSKSDITIAARNISERGPGLEGNYRKLHEGLSNIDFLYFHSDKEYKELYSNQKDKRWAFKYTDRYQLSENIKVEVDWSKASDSLVLRDISGEITSIGSEREQHLNQNISIIGEFKNLILKIEQEKNQSLNPLLTNGYEKSPSVDLSFFKNIGNFLFRENLNVSYFKADALHGFFGIKHSNKYLSSLEEIKEGSRIYSDMSLENDIYFSKVRLNTSIGLKSIYYNLKNNAVETKNVNVPTARLSLSSSLYKKNGMFTHLLKPTITYGYVAYKDQKNNPVFDTSVISMNNTIFNNRRFSGKDRVGDQQFYSIGIEYKKRHMNMEKLSLSLSQQFYLKDRKVFLNDMMMQMNMNMGMGMMDMNTQMMEMPMDEGPLILMGKWMPSMKTMVMSYGSYLKDSKKMPMGGFTLNHKFTNGNLGYAKRYRRMSGDFDVVLDYSEFYTNFKLNNSFSLIAKLKRDDENNTKIESSFGIGYENCCFIFSLTASDKNLSKYLTGINSNSYTYLNEAWDNIIRIENKSRLNFQFQLKGLNSSLNKVGRLFDNTIFNY